MEKWQRIKEDRLLKSVDFEAPYGFTTYIFDRKMLIENKVQFPQYKLYEDPLFLTRAMSCTEEYYVMSKIVYRHRVRIHIEEYTKERILEVLKSLTEMLEIAIARGWRGFAISLIEGTHKRFYPHICRYVKKSEQDIIEQLSQINALLDIYLSRNEKGLVSYFSLQGIWEYIKKVDTYIEKVCKIIDNYDDIIVYGAGQAGEYITEYIRSRLNKNICGIAVTSMKGNIAYVRGNPVRTIEQFMDFKETGLFIVATAECYQETIVASLRKRGVENICYVDYKMIYVAF